MRMWHKDLINVLPREQLVAQWRELSSIAGNINTKGAPNHLLVNKIMDYPFDHFISYAFYIRQEMTKRGYKTMDKVWDKIISVANGQYKIIPFEELYPEWMEATYFNICYYNLLEKYLCGGIKKEDFEGIVWLYSFR